MNEKEEIKVNPDCKICEFEKTCNSISVGDKLCIELFKFSQNKKTDENRIVKK